MELPDRKITYDKMLMPLFFINLVPFYIRYSLHLNVLSGFVKKPFVVVNNWLTKLINTLSNLSLSFLFITQCFFLVFRHRLKSTMVQRHVIRSLLYLSHVSFNEVFPSSFTFIFLTLLFKPAFSFV